MIWSILVPIGLSALWLGALAWPRRWDDNSDVPLILLFEVPLWVSLGPVAAAWVWWAIAAWVS